MSVGAWARAHGVDGRSLNAWRLNLAQSAAPRLVEPVPVTTEHTGARYVVRVGDVALELGADFDDATLVRLVRALRAC